MVETPLDNTETRNAAPERQVANLAHLALGLGDNPDIPETPPEDPHLKNAGEWVEQYFEASYGVLPEDHPLTLYVASLNARFPQLNVKFKILPGWKEINAAALPNNTILLSAGIIEFCEHEEELMFVLGHERTHLKHHLQRRGEQTRSVLDLLKEIGHHRFAEYEADLRGITEEMDHSGINPYGGKYFLERLAELETKKGEQKDLVHGGSLDRMLNISTATRLFDLKELAMDLTPWAGSKDLPESSPNLQHSISSRLPADSAIQWHVDKNLDDLQRSEKNAILFGNDIYKRVQGAAAYAKDFHRSLYGRMDLQFARDLFSTMQKNTDEMVRDLFPHFSPKEKEIFKVFMYHFVGGMPVLSDAKLSSAFWDSIETEEDFEKLAEVCSEANFQKTGFFAIGDFEKWLRALLVHACELGLFGEGKEFNHKKYADFANKLCCQLESFSRSFGTAAFDPKKMEGLIHEVAEPSIGKNAHTPEAADSIEFKVDACITDVIRNYPEPPEIKEREDHNYLEQKKAYKQKCDAYTQSKTQALLAIHRFSTGKELVQYVVGFLKRSEKKLDSREESIFISLMKSVWLFIEPDIEKNFLVENFLDTLSPSGKYLLEIYGSFRHTEKNLEHNARSLFDATYRKEVYGIEEEEGKSNEEDIEKRKSDFIERNLIEYFKSLPTKKALLAAMKKYESYGFDFSRGSEFISTYSVGCQFFLARIFEKHDFSTENLDATDIELLLLLSNFMVDVSRAMRLQSILLKKMMEGKSFDEEIDILLKNERTNSYGDVGLRDEWIETKSHTPNELHGMEDAAMKSVEAWLHSESLTEFLGEWAFLDVIEGFWKDKITILIYLIQSQESDADIKKYLLEKYRLRYYEKVETEKAAEQLVKCDAFLNSVWGFSAEMRYALLRILLMGKDGIFRSKKSREAFFHKFLKTTLTENGEEDDLRQLLFDIGPVLAEIDDPELFYFAFLPLLYRRFARYPKQTAPWLEVLKKAKIPQPKTILRKYDKMTKRGSYDLREDRNYDSVYATAVNNFIDEKFLKPSESVEEAPLSPLALIIEIAKSLGAAGVRFLQLLGQYMEVPEEYGGSFSDVYDQMRGQSKLAAYRLIKREWPDFAQTIKTMRPRVGGGSLMTVYEVETKDGNREVLKVLNPNVKFHLDRVFGFLEKLVEALVKKFGPAYEPVSFALNDIQEWITRDVTLDEFLADDQRFAIKNDGFQVEHGPENYRIGVPKTHEPENRYFIREEFVDGKNLTQWDELVAEGHDMKKIVSLLCKNYMAQIADGQAHADIHVGNIRIAADKTCYILDRAGYLKFDDEDKRLFVAFSGAPRETFCEIVTAYFRKNNDMPDLENRVASAFEEMTSPQDLLLRLKKAKIKVPLKISLLMKNLSVLDIFAKKAGFTGLQEILAA